MVRMGPGKGLEAPDQLPGAVQQLPLLRRHPVQQRLQGPETVAQTGVEEGLLVLIVLIENADAGSRRPGNGADGRAVEARPSKGRDPRLQQRRLLFVSELFHRASPGAWRTG